MKKIKQIEVVDVLGKAVIIKIFAEVGNCAVDVSSLPKGLYLVRVTDKDNNMQTRKLIVE